MSFPLQLKARTHEAVAFAFFGFYLEGRRNAHWKTWNFMKCNPDANLNKKGNSNLQDCHRFLLLPSKRTYFWEGGMRAPMYS